MQITCIMILGFLGKGGSGKSSVATQMALFLHNQGTTVLAIDADHNMDLSFNLGQGTLPVLSYLGDGLLDIKQYLGIPETEKYDQYFLRDEAKSFSISAPDVITQKYSTELKPQLRLMAAGPQTDIVLHGQSCSHILTTPLKMYLPLLALNHSEVVVVDEKAGADGVTTGIVTGIDVGIIVVEPALHSIKTALQIAELMKFYNTPFMFVGNKINSLDDTDFITTSLGCTPITFLDSSAVVAKVPGHYEPSWQIALNEIFISANKSNQNNRLERTKEKFKRNLDFLHK
jgi:CO dehydrogenase maturation factor